MSAAPKRLEIGIRPESILVAPSAEPETPFPAELVWVERLGARSILDLMLGGAPVKAAVPAGGVDLVPGQAAWCGFRPQSHHLLDPSTGRFLR